jgi:hypothetical protein
MSSQRTHGPALGAQFVIEDGRWVKERLVSSNLEEVAGAIRRPGERDMEHCCMWRGLAQPHG